MIVPFLDHTPHFTQFTSDGVNSAQSMMDAIRTGLLAAGWTEPGAAYTLYAPARADGIQIRLTVAIGANAAQITFVVRDHAGRLINNDTLTRMNVATNTVHNLYYSDTYLYVESNVATNMWGCAVMHREPDKINEPVPVYFASIGPRKNDDTTTNNFAVYNNWFAAGGSGGSGGEMWAFFPSSWTMFTVQGSMLFVPFEFGVNSSWFYGRLPNVLRLSDTQYAGNTFNLPLDEVTTGTFRVVRSGGVAASIAAIRIA